MCPTKIGETVNCVWYQSFSTISPKSSQVFVKGQIFWGLEDTDRRKDREYEMNLSPTWREETLIIVEMETDKIMTSNHSILVQVIMPQIISKDQWSFK